MVTFCTMITSATATAAEALAASLRAAEPSARLLACVHDADPEPGGFDELVDAQTAPTVAALLQHALRGSETAIYLAPEARVYASLDSVHDALAAEGSQIVLFSRAAAVPDDGKRPDDGDLLKAGRISDAAVAVTRGTDSGSFLDWWGRRLDDEASDRPWLDLVVERFAGVRIVEDPGCNVSSWNLHERRLEGSAAQPLVDTRPLRFIDFTGFRADRPYWLAEQATRVLVMDQPLLAELCGAYAAELRALGWTPPRRDIAELDRLGNSQRIDHLVRALWDRAIADGEDFGDPLRHAAADAFVAWMRGPAHVGSAAGVNRYLYAAYLTRPDLQEAFPDLDGPDGKRLVAWAWEHGRRELLGELLPPAPRGAAAVTATLGVNVIGYLGETLGLAEAARCYVCGLQAAGIPVSTTALVPDLPVDDGEQAIERYGSGTYAELRTDEEPVFNLACLNGDHLAAQIRKQGVEFLGQRPTIGQWGWETDVLPPSWTAAFDHLDEVWVYSTFMAENLGRLLPMPVVVVPPAVVAPAVDPGALSIARDDRFTFLFMLDLFSTLRRKNPIGVVEAFTRAFASGEGPRLIVKTINARFRPEAAEELRHSAASHPDVEFIDDYLEPAQKAALLARADCYVSLHRSEGFGLPLAEAMALGTPVIATGYSGNTDFTTPFNSYLVDHRPTNVGPDCEIYPPHGRWAEPDLDHAAEQMRRVWEKPEEAAARARRARAEITRDYAPKVVGEIARARLERLSDIRAGSAEGSRSRRRTSATAAEAFRRAEQAMAFDLRQGVGGGGVGGFARRRLMRMMLPFTFHERKVDQALLDAVRELRRELDGDRARDG